MQVSRRRLFAAGLGLFAGGVGVGAITTWFATRTSPTLPKPLQSTPAPTASTSFGAPHVTQITAIRSGLGGAIGSQYVPNQDSLYFVEYDSGNLSVISDVNGTPSYHILGTGYMQSEAVFASSDGDTVYITQRSRGLVKVNLSALDGPNSRNAQPIAQNLSAPQQFVINELENKAYVVEFNDMSNVGRVVEIDIGSGTVHSLLENLPNPIGILLAPDRHTLYITVQLSDNKGQLVCYNFFPPERPKMPTLLAQSKEAPLFNLTWANAAKTAILTTERDPANKVWYFDLDQPSLGLQFVAPVAYNPSSVAVVSNNGAPLTLLVCTDGEIDKLT